jgi:hypothetical protein
VFRTRPTRDDNQVCHTLWTDAFAEAGGERSTAAFGGDDGQSKGVTAAMPTPGPRPIRGRIAPPSLVVPSRNLVARSSRGAQRSIASAGSRTSGCTPSCRRPATSRTTATPLERAATHQIMARRDRARFSRRARPGLCRGWSPVRRVVASRCDHDGPAREFGARPSAS